MKLLSGFVECRKELGLHDLLSPSIHILVSLSLELSHYLFGDSLNEGSLHRGIFAWNIVAHWLEFTLTSLEGTIPDSWLDGWVDESNRWRLRGVFHKARRAHNLWSRGAFPCDGQTGVTHIGWLAITESRLLALSFVLLQLVDLHREILVVLLEAILQSSVITESFFEWLPVEDVHLVVQLQKRIGFSFATTTKVSFIFCYNPLSPKITTTHKLGLSLPDKLWPGGPQQLSCPFRRCHRRRWEAKRRGRVL